MAETSNKWYRIGEANEFSEFTFDPEFFARTGEHRSGNMTGGRGTGVATGQYAFNKPQPEPDDFDVREGLPIPLRIEIEPAKNPARIGWLIEDVYEFQALAISMLRLAEGSKSGYGGMTPMEVWMKLNRLRPKHVPCEQGEKDVMQAIADWSICKQVHPMNILLSRWGFDGIEYIGELKKYGNQGTYGNVKFPPVDDSGCLLCMIPKGHTYMTLDEQCAATITDAKKKLCGMMRKAVSDEMNAGGEYTEMAGLDSGDSKEVLLGIAEDEKRHREIIKELIGQICR